MELYPEPERVQGLVLGQVLALPPERVQGPALVQARVQGPEAKLRTQHKKSVRLPPRFDKSCTAAGMKSQASRSAGRWHVSQPRACTHLGSGRVQVLLQGLALPQAPGQELHPRSQLPSSWQYQAMA